MSIYQTLLNLITRPANIPLPPYPAPPEDMTLETAQAKHTLVLRLLPAFSDDPDFQTYLPRLHRISATRRAPPRGRNTPRFTARIAT